MNAEPMTVAWIGLVGVAVGWLLNALTEWLRRRWDRADKREERAIERGEELLQHCAELVQWSEEGARAAFHGKEVYIPIQHPMYRIAAIVDVYFPELTGEAKVVDKSVTALRESYIDIVTRRHSGLPMAEELRTTMLVATRDCLAHIRSLMTATRKRARSRLDAG